MGLWRTVRLDEVCEINKESYSSTDNWDFVNYLDTGNITNNKINEIQHIELQAEKLPSRARRKTKKNSIIYSTVRPVQRHFGIIKSQPENFLVSTGFAVIDVDEESLNADFLYYWLTQRRVIETLQAIAEQGKSTYPAVKASDIANLKIDIPPISAQKRIADILNCLDAKINLNMHLNENLQEQANTIFLHWFVDLAPFGGVVPSDWKISTLGVECKCMLGGTPSRAKSEYWKGNIPWINSGEVNLFRITQPSEYITELGLKNSATKLLPQKTTVIAITGTTLGQISLLEIDACTNQSVIGVIPNSVMPYEFIYAFIQKNIKNLITHQTGGAQQHINKQNVESLPIIVPDRNTMYSYISNVKGIYEMIANRCLEVTSLISMRDTLLSQLMMRSSCVLELDT